MTKPNKGRRRFLKISAAVGGGLALGIYFLDQTEDNGKSVVKKILADKNLNAANAFFPSVYFLITADNRIIVNNACSEMGQGVMTSITMLIAEELDADWSRIHVEFAPAHKAFVNPSSGRQVTGGSRSVRGYWQAVRQAGASARLMLLEAAAQNWQVAMDECVTENNFVIHRASNKRLSYGELSQAAAKLPVPSNVTLKNASQYKFIGKPQPRLDSRDKATGKAMFGIDVQLPGMLVAAVVRCPVFGGTLKQVDDTQAKQVNGVKHIVVVDSGVAVVATHYGAVQKARKLLNITWDEGKNASLSTNGVRELTLNALRNATVIRDEGEAPANDAALRIIKAEYELPYLAHACMEPMNCTAHVRNDECDVWAPTQSQERTHDAAAKITGLPKSKIHVHTTFLGGGFGRRSEEDFVKDAVQLSNLLRVPVKVVWSREDDIQHDYYRPYSLHELQCVLDEKGNALSWQHGLACQSILARFVPMAKTLFFGNDATSTEGAENIDYRFPHIKVSYGWSELDVPVGFWRSVSHSHNNFVTECFFDEMAAAGGRDPLQMRLDLLKDHPRYLGVLNLAAEKSQWHVPLDNDRARGIAVSHCFESYIAQVAEVSIDRVNKKIIVHRVVCAVDCGQIVNPDTIAAQIEGGIMFGLTAALYGEVTLANGRIQQSNYHDYPCVKLRESPSVDVFLVDSTEAPGGVGEIGVPPIAPAVANALFKLTGQAVRKLPINTAQYFS